MNRVLRVSVIVLLLTACAPEPSANGLFPIIATDPDELVETMVWDGEIGVGIPDPATFEEPIVLDTSTPETITIFVKGGSCPPTAQVAVSGNPSHTRIDLKLGGSIEPPVVSCKSTLTTHALVVDFNQPIDLAGLEVTATRSSPISEG